VKRYAFRILNVFAESVWSGNALAVFEDGSALSDEEMQALALQLNLSETTFLLPSTTATAQMRIFTPSFEMPFAGHPTLGTAHVVRALFGCGDQLTLETLAGVIPVTAEGDTWTLKANSPRARDAEATASELANMLGIEEEAVRERPMWIDTGSEQLLVRLRDPSDVLCCRPDPLLLARYGSNAKRTGLVYVWAHEDAPPGPDGERIVSRFFFLKQGALVEDPGTGSACANLGGWFLTTKHELPLALCIRQGQLTGRPCKLLLNVEADGKIFVTGGVIEVGRGEMSF
jgi:trans-2,3-dihydro-3-hydroxyanthranilate isomerase